MNSSINSSIILIMCYTCTQSSRKSPLNPPLSPQEAESLIARYGRRTCTASGSFFAGVFSRQLKADGLIRETRNDVLEVHNLIEAVLQDPSHQTSNKKAKIGVPQSGMVIIVFIHNMHFSSLIFNRLLTNLRYMHMIDPFSFPPWSTAQPEIIISICFLDTMGISRQ